MALLERAAQSLRGLRHGALRGLPAPVLDFARRAAFAALEAGTLGRGRAVRVAGRYPLRVGWDRSAINFEEWEAEFMTAMGENLRPDSVVYDVGASVGEWAAVAASLTPAGAVHAFEPDPASWRELFRIFRRNRLPPPAGSFCGFACAEEGPPPQVARGLAPPPESHARSKFEDLLKSGTIPRITLDSYGKRKGVRPDLIKIDVEGAEGEVLRGATRTLAEDRPVILLSLHPPLVGRYGDSRESLLADLEARGYGHVLLASSHEEHYLCRPSAPRPPGQPAPETQTPARP